MLQRMLGRTEHHMLLRMVLVFWPGVCLVQMYN